MVFPHKETEPATTANSTVFHPERTTRSNGLNITFRARHPRLDTRQDFAFPDVGFVS
jgi:hypothetical protein